MKSTCFFGPLSVILNSSTHSSSINSFGVIIDVGYILFSCGVGFGCSTFFCRYPFTTLLPPVCLSSFVVLVLGASPFLSMSLYHPSTTCLTFFHLLILLNCDTRRTTYFTSYSRRRIYTSFYFAV